MEREYFKNCNAIYELALKEVYHLYSKNEYEKTLLLISKIAHFAWFNHPGFYTDGRIEDIACEIGKKLDDLVFDDPTNYGTTVQKDQNGGRNILHVATQVYTVGGHTKWIENWMQMDSRNTHSAVLLSQDNVKFPDSLERTVNERRGYFIKFPGNIPLLNKAKMLRKIARSGFDMVILHHHPDDVVPIVAFSSEDCPSVAIANHADHVFWLGSSIADLVINIRNCGKILSEERRCTAKNILLPLPFNEKIILRAKNNIECDPEKLDIKKQEARETLGVPKDQVMIITMGSAYKYMPNKDQNFFRTALKILEKDERIHIYIIGISIDDFKGRAFWIEHERLHCLGVMPDPQLYQEAADICLSSYPFGSVTALMENILYGCAPVMPYAPKSKMFMSEDIAFRGVLEYAKTEEDHINQVMTLVNSSDLRTELIKKLQIRILECHSGKLWKKYLNDIYQCLDSTSHSVKEIPQISASETDDDIALSIFHEGLGGQFLLRFINRVRKYIRLHICIYFFLRFFGLAFSELMEIIYKDGSFFRFKKDQGF